MMTLLRALLVWLLLMAAETIHGVARTLWLAPLVGEFGARQIAVFSGSLLILLIAVFMIRWIGLGDGKSLIAIGVFWVVLTVSFEIGLGLSLGYSWDRLTSDYDLRNGGLLPIGLLAMAFSPWLAARFRRACVGPGA